MVDESLPVRDPSAPDEPDIELTHVVVRNPSAPDECAIFPSKSEALIDHRWITATGDSFVCLSDCL